MQWGADSSLPSLHSGHVHVSRFSLEADASEFLSCWRVLSTDERQRAERFAFPELRRRFVVTRANLRHLLGHHAQIAPGLIRFSYGPTGKPELANHDLHFNLSHSGEQGLIALTRDGAVGVDLEMIRPMDYDAVVRKVLPPADVIALSQASADSKADLFFKLWVRHEARVKAVGASIGTLTEIPTYDLELGAEYRGAVATAIENVRVTLFEQ